MATLEELRAARLAKIEKLKEKGMTAFPAASSRTHAVSQVIADFDALSTSATKVVVAGRVMAMRPQGGLAFINLFDGTGTLQALLKKGEVIADDTFDLFIDTVDIGDFVEVSGTLFVTKRGEKTVQVGDWKMLTKSLRPLPEKWHGIENEEERLRKRYLDILTRPEMRELFEKKARFWKATRDFLAERGFLEVETPTLEITTGGAEARPFKTHHNDFDIDVYLRISVGELWQKRLMAAGFPKTFEIGRVYRNEGTSPEHLQEFTNMEFYWGYADFKAGMQLVKELYRFVAKETFGTTKFSTRGHDFDLADEWIEIDYVSEIKKQTGVDVVADSEAVIKEKLIDLKVKFDGENRERLTDSLWKYCRKQITGPAFLVNHPLIVGPLAKANADGKTVQMFQPIIAGSEVGRGYSELNDPIDQAARFEAQQKLIDSGDEEAMMPDWEFVEMLEHGMPPTCGFGFGERLFAFLVDKPLRETQLFPLLRPKHTDTEDK